LKPHSIIVFFKRLLIALGKKDGDFTIEIHGMSVTEAAKFEEKRIARYQAGLISRARAISKLDRISLEEAEEITKEIEKEEKARQALEMKDKENGGVNNNAKI